MLTRLIQFSLTQRLLMLLAVLVLIGGGWYSFRSTPIDAFPDVSTTQVKVIVRAPGYRPSVHEAWELPALDALPVPVPMEHGPGIEGVAR